MAGIDWEGPSDWQEWSQWLASGLHGRNRWRLPLLLIGILFAGGRRTVTTWLRAAGISLDYDDYYYFLASVGRNSKLVSMKLLSLVLRQLPLPERVLLVVDDTPTKRYGPHVEGADIHHNPTPGPADQQYLYGHVWVTVAIALRHPRWGAMALPIFAMLYVRERTMAWIPACREWTFQTKLELAVRMIRWMAPILKFRGKTVWVAADGAFAKRAFLMPLQELGIVVVSRLRKDANLRTVPDNSRPKRGRPRIYGKDRIDLAKRAGQSRGWQTITSTLYGQLVTKTYKTFRATYGPAGGEIRVVIVKEQKGWQAFLCTDPHASVQEILEAFADRATIEQCFHDQKEVWGTGKQQVRNIWTNVGVFHMNLWMHTLVELWSWNRHHEEICDRSASPWDDPERRPSHADRRKALRQHIIDTQLSKLDAASRLPRKIVDLARRLLQMAT